MRGKAIYVAFRLVYITLHKNENMAEVLLDYKITLWNEGTVMKFYARVKPSITTEFSFTTSYHTYKLPHIDHIWFAREETTVTVCLSVNGIILLIHECSVFISIRPYQMNKGRTRFNGCIVNMVHGALE